MIFYPSPAHRAILALDLGTTTGWALRLPDKVITHGFVSFKCQRFEGGGMRFLNFRRWLDRMADELEVIDWVAFDWKVTRSVILPLAMLIRN